jgi:single-stranded-DNA-specific exonuclease
VTKAKKCWKYRKEVECSKELIEACGSKTIARLLANRGLTNPQKATEFLYPSKDKLSSPYEFQDMPKVVERVTQAIESGENILIWGDYDVDGITSTSILLKTLRFLGAKVSYYLPDRMSEGYGMNSTSLLKMISSRKARLIITCDCGISNLTEISLANNFKVDTIITDHHEMPELLPPAYAIINPKQLYSDSKMTNLCGAGVSYKVSLALLEHYNKKEFAEELLYLAAIGTIADLVPLKDENRLIAYLGLQDMVDNPSPAIAAIAKSAGVKLEESLKASKIAFQIAPRLNAIGRLAQAASAVELLTTDNPKEIEILASELEQHNRNRQQLCDTTFDQAVQLLRETDLNTTKAIVLADPDWHPGIIGIVASRLVDAFYRPSFLMAVGKEETKGSARSIEGIHLFNTMTEIHDVFTKFGGHEMAAGFSLLTENINKFKSRITGLINNQLENIIPQPCLHIEMDIDPSELTLELIEKINRLEPFGQENPELVLSCNNLYIRNFKLIGTEDNHMKLFLKTQNTNVFEALWWQNTTFDFDPNQPVKVAFYPEVNTYKSETRIQLIVKDILPMQESSTDTTQHRNTIKWVDHRNKPDITKFLKSYTQLNNSKTAIFAETKQLKDKLTPKYDIISRNCTDHYDQIILLEYPAEEGILTTLIRNTEPQIIHLTQPVQYKVMNEVDIFKTVLKMLKYASNNKNSEANLKDIATFLGTSFQVISKTIDALVAADILEILSFKEDTLKFRMNVMNGLNISQLKELNEVKTEIINVHNYRKKMFRATLEEYSRF